MDGPIGLGHTRLAIIDLNTGAQPLSNEDKTVWVVFNGEIYNFQPLRRELQQSGPCVFIATTGFRSHSPPLRRIRGWIVFPVFGGCLRFASVGHQKKKRLLLARDRVGIKPLYFANKRHKLSFLAPRSRRCWRTLLFRVKLEPP